MISLVLIKIMSPEMYFVIQNQAHNTWIHEQIMNFIFKQIYSIQCRVLSHKNMTKYWKIPQSFWKTNCITNKEESFNNILRKYRLNLINPGQNNGIQHLIFNPWTLSTTLNTFLRGSPDHTRLVTMVSRPYYTLIFHTMKCPVLQGGVG